MQESRHSGSTKGANFYIAAIDAIPKFEFWLPVFALSTLGGGFCDSGADQVVDESLITLA
jgi:hypothetical protein